MRTSVILDDRLHKQAKVYEVKTGITLAALIEEAPRMRLSLGEPKFSRRRVRLPTFRGDGLKPGVNLNDMKTVYDRMDRLQ